MLKILGIVAVLLVVVVAGILIYAATKPNDFRVQRSLAIKAPADRIYAQIADFHLWGGWSPYEKKDPDMKRTFSGAAAGTGAAYAWEGDKNVGTGHMEILEATVPSKVRIKLDFLKPFEGHNTAEFTMVPSGDATTVTWAMYGPAPYIHKLMGTFFNMDRMIGDDFAIGLANLEAIAEK